MAKMKGNWRPLGRHNKVVAAMLVDLSKVLLSEHKQRVKIGNAGSSWSEIIKGYSFKEVATSLENSTLTALKLFGNNLKANPSKYQAIVFDLKAKSWWYLF